MSLRYESQTQFGRTREGVGADLRGPRSSRRSAVLELLYKRLKVSIVLVPDPVLYLLKARTDTLKPYIKRTVHTLHTPRSTAKEKIV